MRKKLVAGLFVDDANMYFAQKMSGWKIDFKKIISLLNQEVDLVVRNYYIAIPSHQDVKYKQTEAYVKGVQGDFTIQAKPLKYIKTEAGILKKGDVDLEIALDVVRNFNNLDMFLIMSGDSDYVELRKYVLENGKKIIFLGMKCSLSWEIKRGKYLVLDGLRPYIERGKKTPRDLPGRLLLTASLSRKKD